MAFYERLDGLGRCAVGAAMQAILYARHHLPPDIIRHAVWLYLRFTLSSRDVEELLAECGLDASYDTGLVTA